jgi:hypothetical protein
MNPDTDGDGLLDGDEVNALNAPQNISSKPTDPTDKDSDDDGLSDGYEASLSHTDPNNIDTDGDGVTDGIEACGTNTATRDGNGYVVSTLDAAVNIDEKSSSFYDDIISVATDAINANNLNGVSDDRCQSPANLNSSDIPDIIDALDKTNDSDGDQRPNINEKEKGTDPLYAGSCSSDSNLTACAQNDIDTKAYYPWITQTPDGQKMVEAGFVYVPKADSKGFWVSKYEARCQDGSNSCSNDDVVVFKNFNNTSSRNNLEIDVAKELVTNSSIADTDYSLILPMRSQYQDIFKVKSGTGNTNCIIIKNSVGDANMPKNAQDEICEITDSNKEFVKYSDGTYRYNNGVTFDSGTNPATDTTFRATTNYIK